MKIYYGLEEASALLCGIGSDQSRRYSVVSVGSFDGVHAGHRTLLSRMNEYRDGLQSEGVDAVSVVVTFLPHPRQVLSDGVALLNSVEEKAVLLSDSDIDIMIVVRFDNEFRSLNSAEFFDMLCRQLNMRVLVAGYDHRFGCDGAHGEQALKALGQRSDVITEVMPEYEIDGAHISSTEVRKALKRGNVSLVCRLLTRPYLLVTSALDSVNDQCAAFCVDEDKLLPECGEYRVVITDMANKSFSKEAIVNIAPDNNLFVSREFLEGFSSPLHLCFEFV